MIKKIAIENFRVFKEYTEFEIEPINILTGPNNSGKSSLIKLLNLLKKSFNSESGLNVLRFQDGIHNLGTFNNVLTRSSSKNYLKLVFDFPLPGFDQTFLIELIYTKSFYNKENGALVAVKIFNQKRTLVRFGTASNEDYNIVTGDLGMGIDNYYTIDLEYLKNQFGSSDELVFSYTKDGKPVDDEYFDLFLAFEQIFSSVIIGFEASALADGNYNHVTDWIWGLINLRNNAFSWFFEDVFFSEEEHIKISHKLINRYLENKNLNEDDLPEDEMIKIQNFLDDIEKIKFDVPGEFSSFIQTQLIENVMKGYKKLLYSLLSIDHLSAVRGSQKRVLMNESQNDLDELVRLYSTTQAKSKNDFLNSCLDILGIEGELDIKRKEGAATYAYIKNSKEKSLLADLGFGYSQILPIILKIIIIASLKEDEWYEKNPYDVDDLPKAKQLRKKIDSINESITEKNEKGKSLKELEDQSIQYSHLLDRIERLTKYAVLIIEEPEANLHPNFQSKLADILVLAQKEFNIKFILETHSEYFIRKLQYLTAKNQIDPGSVNINYFNDDKYVSHKESKVKLIQIDRFGALSDSFGPGFFDEATRLQFELLRLNKEQTN